MFLAPAPIALVDVVGPTNFDAWADQVKADGTSIRVIYVSLGRATEDNGGELFSKIST